MTRRHVAGALLALGAAALLAAVLLPGGERTYRAELTSARGLVVGNDVRVLGAVAGSVRSLTLSRRGVAVVTFTLNRGVPAPRADATAGVRPVDLLGDNYLALDPGRATAPLRGPISAARTTDAPRLDELLATFQPSVRDGLRLLLVESGVALDGRGADLGRATIALRPALDAAGAVARELATQNAALARLVADGERGVGQLARRERDLGPLVDGLDVALRSTAAQGAPLDTTLRGAPALLGKLGATAARLSRTARAARPVAVALRSAAAPLGSAVRGLPALAGQLDGTATALRPAVEQLRSLLVGGTPTLRALTSGLQAVGAVAPQTDRLLSEVVPAAPLISKGFFVNFADQAAEPGKQPFDPFADPRRAYWRGAAVFSCETFGVPVRPGCLSAFVSQSPSSGGRSHKPGSGLGLSGHAPLAMPPAAAAAPAAPAPAAPTSAQRLLNFLLG
jgi:ABC-type transporter Mla subunit MlaD